MPKESEDLGPRMSWMEHLKEFRDRAVKAILTVAIIVAGSFTLTIRQTTFNGYPIYYPFPDPFNNVASLLLKKLQNDLLPSYVQVIVTTPWDALIALFYSSIFIGVTLGMPMIVYQTVKFVSPGLYPHEKKLIARLSIPAACLFVAGVVFAYILILPFTIDFLFRYAIAINLTTFLTIDSFISFVLLFMFAFGIAFELPLIMVLLTSLGVVEPSFWREHFSLAFVVMCVFGAVITPDGSGVTMFMVAGPMLALYLAGWYISSRHKVKIG
ncbi:twin-arginine translocase subunit TatC [Candidatus Bathyarchaeota archaeon]|nr:MAG: twin-arginine translocase subunit TatC [Candidatus Hecatellales archaeon]RLI34955.1 MAG: twin-arginine translocase subunit TatC [Candidatus Bathyarchaeota archaeon]